MWVELESLDSLWAARAVEELLCEAATLEAILAVAVLLVEGGEAQRLA